MVPDMLTSGALVIIRGNPRNGGSKDSVESSREESIIG